MRDASRDEDMNEEIPPSELRIGVVVCGCGGAIADRMDVESLHQHAARLPGVAYSTCEPYPCSKDGQVRLRQMIAEHKLDRVLIAGCTPRLIEKLFQQAAGLGNGGVEVTDIREQCACVHNGDRGAATRKAADLIEMGVARLAETSMPHAHTGRVVKAAMVIGGGLSGLTVALALADNGIDVMLVEQASELGDASIDDRAREQIAERIEKVPQRPCIRTLLNARVIDVHGRPGDYEVRVARGDQTTVFAVGAIVVAADALPENFGSDRWYDRSRVKTQAEFERELEAAERQSHSEPRRGEESILYQSETLRFAHALSGAKRRGRAGGVDKQFQDIVMILCGEDAGGARCSRVCCMAGIRQAIRAKQANPDANVTILFRDLFLGGTGDLHADELQQAQKLGVTFFRYSKDHPPTIGDKSIDVPDPLTGEPLRLPFDRAVLSMPIEPPALADQLAALLRVPQDEHGFITEPRIRLRPGRYVDDGVFVLGGAHQPGDAAETLFQAYLTGSRVMRFLSQDTIHIDAPVAEVDATLCTGDGRCVSVCPTAAISLIEREGALSVAHVEPLRCTGCGNCVVACTVKAMRLPGWDDAAVLAQISAALRERETSRIIAFACEWSAYAAADMAGARGALYPDNVRIIRMPCSARFDPDHILWAFINGADGVFLGACPPGECHYGSGNLFAKERVETLKKQLAEHGFDPRRLRLEFLSGDDGEKFAEAMTRFVELIKVF